MAKERILNAQTGEVTERDLTTQEEAAAQSVPESVTRFQARQALKAAGLLGTVDAAVAASGNVAIQDAWAEALNFKRQSPSILAMAAALNLTSAQLDDLFRAAAAVTA